MSSTGTAAATSSPKDLNTLAADYARTKDTTTRDRLFEELKPTIGFALSRFGGGVEDPVLRAHAYSMALTSLDKFDPTRGVNVKTFVVSNLQPLRRKRREVRSVTGASERMQLDTYQLQRMEAEFEDKHGRTASEDDLADMTGLSPSRIRKLKSIPKSTPSEYTGGIVDGDAFQAEPVDFQKEAVDYIYDSTDPINQKLLKNYFGFFGGPTLSAREFAAQESIGLATVSDRANKLIDQVQKLTAVLEGNTYV